MLQGIHDCFNGLLALRLYKNSDQLPKLVLLKLFCCDQIDLKLKREKCNEVDLNCSFACTISNLVSQLLLLTINIF